MARGKQCSRSLPFLVIIVASGNKRAPTKKVNKQTMIASNGGQGIETKVAKEKKYEFMICWKTCFTGHKMR